MTNQQGAPEALRPIARYKIGYATDGWGMRSSTPSGIPHHAGAWVRYEDHVAALVEAQQPAPSAAAAITQQAFASLRDDIQRLAQFADQATRMGVQDMHNNMETLAEELTKLSAAPQPSPTPQADSAPVAAPADTVALEAALRAIHQAIDLIGEPDTERLRTVRRVLRGAVVVAEDSNAPQADSTPAAICNACGAELLEVKQSPNSYLSAEQFDADKLGDWYCKCCPKGPSEGSSTHRYFWNRDLGAAAPQADSQPAPIDMVLHCPACGLQHIDAPDERTPDWKNEPHRSHLCHGCGHIWRPADVPTNGVAAVKTTGKADSPIAARAPADSVLYDPKAVLEIFNSARAGSEKPVGYLRGILAVIAHWESRPEPHRWMVPAKGADSVLEDAARLEQIAEAIRDYHHALDMRKHGGLAENAAFISICNTMGMHWNRGEESARRAARKQGGTA